MTTPAPNPDLAPDPLEKKWGTTSNVRRSTFNVQRWIPRRDALLFLLAVTWPFVALLLPLLRAFGVIAWPWPVCLAPFVSLALFFVFMLWAVRGFSRSLQTILPLVVLVLVLVLGGCSGGLRPSIPDVPPHPHADTVQKFDEEGNPNFGPRRR